MDKVLIKASLTMRKQVRMCTDHKFVPRLLIRIIFSFDTLSCIHLHSLSLRVPLLIKLILHLTTDSTCQVQNRHDPLAPCDQHKIHARKPIDHLLFDEAHHLVHLQ